MVPETIDAVKSVSVSTAISGNIMSQFSCSNMFGKHVVLTLTHGIIGVPVDIITESEFSTADLSFEYDIDKLGYHDENDLRIAWYNDNEGEYVFFEDYNLDTENHRITVTTNHFSYYVLIDIKEYLEYLGIFEDVPLDEIKFRAGRHTIHLCVNIGTDFVKSNSSSIKTSLLRFDNARRGSEYIGIQSITKTRLEASDSSEEYHSEDKYALKTKEFEFAKSDVDRKSIIDYVTTLQPHEKVCSPLNELNAIKTYFENNATVNKKAVVWITSTTLSNGVNSRIYDKVTDLKNDGIAVYQIHIGEPLSTFRADVEKYLQETGGELIEINDSSGFVTNVNNVIQKVKSCDTLIVINSGAYQVHESINDVSVFVNSIAKSSYINRIGLLDVYEESTGNSYSSGSLSAGVYNYNHVGLPMDSSMRIKQAINNHLKVNAEDSKCDVTYEYKFMSDYFDMFSNWDEIIYKTSVLISDNTFSSKYMYGKYFDNAKSSGIKMYMIYLGSNDSNVEMMAQLFRDTGGDLICIDGDIKKFDEAVSKLIYLIFGRSDNKDSDGDGITDVFELMGMKTHDGNMIYTNYEKRDTDEDGRDDGYEMNCWDSSGLAIDTVFHYKSNPEKKDSDNDGYLDYGERLDHADADKKPLEYAFTTTNINESEKFIPIENYYGAIQYGANQSWWEHERNALEKAKTDSTIKVVNESGYTEHERVEDISSKGCGLIAALQLFLYLARNASFYSEDMKGFYGHVKGQISYKEFSEWVFEYMVKEDAFFDVEGYDWFGMWGPELAKWSNGYLEKSSCFVGWMSLSGIDRKTIVKMIKGKLSQKLPVLLLIGIHNLFIQEKVSLYSDYKNKTLSSKTDKHWVTITAMIEDDQTDKIWLQVQSWGNKYYIDLDDWLLLNMRDYDWDGLAFPFTSFKNLYAWTKCFN